MLLNDTKLKTSEISKNVFKNTVILNENTQNPTDRKIGENEYNSNTFSEFSTFNDFNSRKKPTITQLMNSKNDGEEDYFEGTIVKNQKSGFCRIMYSSGVYKEVNYENGSLEGEGSFRFPNGVTVF